MSLRSLITGLPIIALTLVIGVGPAGSQVPPSSTEVAAYTGIHAAAHSGDVAEIRRLAESGIDLRRTDGRGRTALHIAAFASHEDAISALADAGLDPNRLDNDRYDIITIAAVANDTELLRAAIKAGGSAGNVTSVYDGTALIAAAHLGNWESLQILIAAGAPLDHVNNLGWTALIEAVVLGDGGQRHIMCVKLLVEAGADRSITDRNGQTPLQLARQRGYEDMMRLLMP